MFVPLTVELAVTLAFIEEGGAVVEVAVVLSKLYWTTIWAGTGAASMRPAVSASKEVGRVRGMVYLTVVCPKGYVPGRSPSGSVVTRTVYASPESLHTLLSPGLRS